MPDVYLTDSQRLSLRDFRYHHGRHEISTIPSFCGGPTVRLGAKAPDYVSFECAASLEVGMQYRIRFEQGHTIQIAMERIEGTHFYARVIEAERIE